MYMHTSRHMHVKVVYNNCLILQHFTKNHSATCSYQPSEDPKSNLRGPKFQKLPGGSVPPDPPSMGVGTGPAGPA